MNLKIPHILAVCALTCLTAQAQTVVGDWQFNTPGDNEGWTGQSYTVNNLHVAAAVSGSETVLTSDNLRAQNDPKIYFPNIELSLPGGTSGWDKYVIRIRQLGTDGVTPVTFDNAGSFAMSTGTIAPPWGTLSFVNGNTGTGGTVPATQVTEANGWNIFTYDLSAYTSGTIAAKTRLDPMAGTVSGTDILGNFEIDYVTITAVTVPEPQTYALLAGIVVLGAGSLKRRRNRTF